MPADFESRPLKLSEPAFAPLRQAAGELGVRAWAVGGYVRDWLLGREQPDLDVVVEDGRAMELAVGFAELTGARKPVLFPRFGTARVTWRDRQIEFASARAESYGSESRKPEVQAVSIEQDLLRRDFTVNAMLLDFEGRLLDPLDGRTDLKRRLLRTPAEPERAFRDDPLRMLRAARFAAQLGFELDPGLVPAMRRLRERARPPVLSAERINDELVKMLVSERPSRALEILDEGGLIELLLPELAACHGVEQGNWHSHDVFGHTLLAVAKAPPDLTVRLAALLHDIGKPPTATPDGAFHGHDRVGAAMAEEVMTRLKFSRAETDRTCKLVRLHLRPIFYDPATFGDGAVRRLARDAGDSLRPLLQLARADMAASAYPDAWKLDDLARRLEVVVRSEAKVLRPPIDGGDIMRIRGIGPGPDVGRIKSVLTDLILEGALAPEREAISAYLAAHPEL